jgi:hypothetical protein
MNDSQSKIYLKNQSTFKEKWIDYINAPPNFDETNRLDSLTPFYKTPHFQNFSDEKKNILFLNNVRFMAEALIVFEQVLLFGYYTNRNKPRYSNEEFSAPFAQFTFEELYHSIAFKHFLASHNVFATFPGPLLTDCHWIKNSFAFIVRNFPGALYICSPRLEALALSYYNEIHHAYKGHEDNSWHKLHQLHRQDELYHIPLNYHFHESFIQEHGIIKTFIGSVLFFLLIQIMLFKVTYGAIAQSFPEKNIFGKIRWTFRFIKWSINIAEAHKGARVIMKGYVNKIKPSYSYIFSFLNK